MNKNFILIVLLSGQCTSVKNNQEPWNQDQAGSYIGTLIHNKSAPYTIAKNNINGEQTFSEQGATVVQSNYSEVKRNQFHKDDFWLRPNHLADKLVIWNRVPKHYCTNLDADFHPFKIQLTMPDQNLQLKISPSPKVEGSGLLLSYNEQNSIYPIPREDLNQFRSSLCSDPEQHFHSQTLFHTVQNWLEKWSPFCRWQVQQGTGWSCEFKDIDISQMKDELQSMKVRTLRKWKRYPYLFSRKLNITEQIIRHITSSTNSYEAMKQICKLIKFSKENELPSVLSENKWQKFICNNAHSSNNKLAIMKWSISFSKKELDRLEQLADKVSKTDHLLVRIPQSLQPSKSFWIRLIPDKEVSENFLYHLLDSQNTTLADIEKNKDMQSSICLLPGFVDFFAQKSKYKLLGFNNENNYCKNLNHKDSLERDQLLKASYAIGEAIIGELDFVVSNGRYKILRLPKGNYKYQLQNLPQAPNRWAPSRLDDLSEGVFSWGIPRQRPKISKF